MSTVNDTDTFLVNRNNTSYQIEAQNMSELQDTDLMLVNRGGVSYKATGADIKDSLGPKGIPNKPSILSPADGAGIEILAESDEIVGFVPWYIVPNKDEADRGETNAVDGVYGRFIDIIPPDANMGYGDRYPWQAFDGNASTSMYWTGTEYPTAGNVTSATLDLTGLGNITSVVVKGGGLGGFTFYKYQFLNDSKAELGTEANFYSATSEYTLNVPAGAQYLKFSCSAGASRRLLLYTITVNDQMLVNGEGPTVLTLSGDKDLSGPLSFKIGDAVVQDLGHTVESSAIATVTGNNVLTLTNNLDLANFRVNDFCTANVPLTVPTCTFIEQTRDGAFSSPTAFNNSWNPDATPPGINMGKANGNYVEFKVPIGTWTINPQRTAGNDYGITVEGTFDSGPTGFTATTSTNKYYAYVFSQPGRIRFKVTGAGGPNGWVLNQYETVFNGNNYSIPSFTGGTISEIDLTNNKIVMEDVTGSWGKGQIVLGPVTSPATGTVSKIDPNSKTMTLIDSDYTLPKRWIVNQDKFVTGPPSPSVDAAPDASGLELFSSAFASTPEGAIGQTGASWQVAAYDDYYFASPIAQELESTTDLTQWPVVPELEQDTQYRCRVRHISLEQSSEWSDASTFKTADSSFNRTTPGQPLIVNRDSVSSLRSIPQQIINYSTTYKRFIAIGLDGTVYVSNDDGQVPSSINFSVNRNGAFSLPDITYVNAGYDSSDQSLQEGGSCLANYGNNEWAWWQRGVDGSSKLNGLEITEVYSTPTENFVAIKNKSDNCWYGCSTHGNYNFAGRQITPTAFTEVWDVADGDVKMFLYSANVPTLCSYLTESGVLILNGVSKATDVETIGGRGGLEGTTSINGGALVNHASSGIKTDGTFIVMANSGSSFDAPQVYDVPRVAGTPYPVEPIIFSASRNDGRNCIVLCDDKKYRYFDLQILQIKGEVQYLEQTNSGAGILLNKTQQGARMVIVSNA